jgi:prolactin regulatory element-binding protein
MSGQRRVTTFYRPRNEEETGAICGAWAPPHHDHVTENSPSPFVLLGREDSINVREYDSPLVHTVHAIETADGRPLQLAVHPSGDGVLCSFANTSKFYEINPKGPWKLKASERELPLLQGIGVQSCIRFSLDGSLLATGGKDGHLRVFAWPSSQLVLDEPHAHRSIQDIDISMDSAYLASTAEDSACRVWDITKGESIAQLQREKDEKFGYCRFSRDGAQAFLFVSVTNGRRGYIGVWNMMSWSKIGSKKLTEAPITSLAVTRDGKSLCLGTAEGDLVVILVRKMEATQVIGTAHVAPVTALEFSRNGRSVLSLGADTSARVSRLKSEWTEWQLYLVLLGMMALSGLLFLAFFVSSLSDDFWKFPIGRPQAAATIWSHPSYQEPETYGL